jgi:Malonyl-CoA decarboxylase C-terminal domain
MVQSWDSVRARTTQGRRIYWMHHRAMPLQPLAFTSLALLPFQPTCMRDVAANADTSARLPAAHEGVHDDVATVAVFYSVCTTQPVRSRCCAASSATRCFRLLCLQSALCLLLQRAVCCFGTLCSADMRCACACVACKCCASCNARFPQCPSRQHRRQHAQHPHRPTLDKLGSVHSICGSAAHSEGCGRCIASATWSQQ